MDAGITVRKAWEVTTDIAQTSVYLTIEDRAILAELMERSGLNRSTVIRLAIRRLHEQGNPLRQQRLLEIADEIKRLA